MAWTRVSAGRLVALLGDLPCGTPTYRSLASRLRLLVAEGRVGDDTRLPSERDLSRALGLSRTTVTRAYGELVASGYATARHGSGTVVRVPGDNRGALGAIFAPRASTPGCIDLTCAAPAAVPAVHQAFRHAAEQLPAQLRGSGYYPEGLPELREKIAARYELRGVPTGAGQIIVTTGALSSLAIVMRLLVRPGARVLSESPSYPNAIETIRGCHGRLVGHAMGDDGWHVPTLETTLVRARPVLGLLMPDFHNPTGALMDARTRAEVAAAFDRTQTVSLVDESSAELALDDVAMPAPFAAFHRAAITVGSASKALWGGFRVGWIRAPVSVVPGLVRARVTLDLGSSVMDQLAVSYLFDDLEAALEDRRCSLRRGRDTLARELRRRLPTWSFAMPAGGLSLWCRLPEPIGPAVVEAAERHGVLGVPGGRFGVDGGHESRLRLPFTGDPAAFPEAVQRLAAAYDEALADRSPILRDRRPLIA
ncbi:MAG: PLP-dependent aminotransferase family protein [Actinomycetota bacterium]|nr:PLP-dependent aminotransferase family protein [Actinomycetota bacterium]